MACWDLYASGDPVDSETARKNTAASLRMRYDFQYRQHIRAFPDGSVSYNERLVGKALHDVRRLRLWLQLKWAYIIMKDLKP